MCNVKCLRFLRLLLHPAPIRPPKRPFPKCGCVKFSIYPIIIVGCGCFSGFVVQTRLTRARRGWGKSAHFRQSVRTIREATCSSSRLLARAARKVSNHGEREDQIFSREDDEDGGAGTGLSKC